MKRLDIKPGDRFSRLTIIEEVEKRDNIRYFKCRCDCEEEIIIELSKMRSGHTRSCGCLRSETVAQRYTTHGCSGTKLYMIWCTMKARCLKPKSNRYKYYGARGIKICSEWFNFELFYQWAVSNGYQEGLTIERKDVNGNYEPENCQWIPKSEQPKNSRSNVIISYNGQEKYLQQWADELGMNRSTIQGRLSRGWSIETTFKTPVAERGKRGAS